MRTELVAASVLLSGVLLAGAWILICDTRQRSVQRQLELAMAMTMTGQPAAIQEEPSIRRRPVRFARTRALSAKILLFNPDNRDAYTLPTAATFAICGLLGVVAAIACRNLAGAPAGLAAGVVAAAASCRVAFGWQQRRYAMRLRQQLPDALQFVITAVCAGFPVLEAFRGIGREAPEPTRTAFARLLDEIALGRSAQEALFDLYCRTKIPEYAIFAVSLAVQSKSGGRLAETLRGLADTVRERLAIAARAKALAGEGTVSAMILSVLPVVTGIALCVIQPGYLDPLFHDPRGQRLLILAVIALISGIVMMRRMIAGVARE
jgi:tight adherence protein B